MYYELAVFVKRVVLDKPFWKDGELWTAVLAGTAAGIWLDSHPIMILQLRAHFGDLLNITGITFGFALTALFFHVEAIGTWRDHPVVRQIASRLITSHVWTITCLLGQIAYILALWIIDFHVISVTWRVRAWLYGALAYLAVYCGCQILNHALTAWWSFTRRDVLITRAEVEEQSEEMAKAPR